MTQAYQASAIAIDGRAVMIEGPPGIGKSSLALSLIDRGAQLIGDDGLLMGSRNDGLFIQPHPNTRGLIEVRNLGLVTLPVCDETRVCLVIHLDRDAPRFIDEPGHAEFLGIAIPRITLYPKGPNLAIKAELALEKFGIALG
ncbi:MAG: HPr kinase/phosphatase C-terminal domain-containing protein [Sphingomonadaceae bacterium]|nr:HPr kinase/phosphatase C-terminal domain-containing protein [Sphingomonadaceae bacterium]